MSGMKSQMQTAFYKHALPYVSAIFEPGDVYALRCLYTGKFVPNSEGVFTTPRKLAEAAVKASFEAMKMWDRDAKGEIDHLPFGVYIIPNPVKESITARVEPDRLNKVNEDDAVKDHEVTRRRCFLVDIDSVKDAGENGRGVRGICATDAERDAASATADDVVAFLGGLGWPDPIRCASGNGAQLTYRLDLPNDQRTHDVIKAATESLHVRFSSATADVDGAVHNASRLWRLPGTMNRKGRDTNTRPHRMAELVELPEAWRDTPVTLDQLRGLVELIGDEAALKTLAGKAAPKTAPKPAAAPARAPERAAAPKRAEAEAINQLGAAVSAPRAAVKVEVPRPARVEAAKQAAASAIVEDTSWAEDALAEIDVTAGRGQWLSVIKAIKGLLGEDGWELFWAWSAPYGGSESEDRKTWDGLAGDIDQQEGARMLMGIAKKYGWSYKTWREQNTFSTQLEQEGDAPYVAPAAPVATRPSSALLHPLSQHWLGTYPATMYDEAVICIADRVIHQLTTVAEPVRLGDKLLVCDPTTFRWEEVGAGDVAVILRGWVNNVVVSKQCNKNKTAYFSGRTPSSKVFDEVLTGTPDVTKLRADGSSQLVLTDGVLRPSPDGTIGFSQLSPQHFATYGYDLSYAEVMGADCPRFLAYVDGLFPGAKDPCRTTEYLLRWIALAVFGATIKFQAPALLLKGKAGTGKSTLGKIVSKLMPPGSTCSVPLQDWEHEYNRAELVGKLFNFVPELAIDEPIGGLDNVKKIIFGERTSARQIYSQVQSFYPQAAHLFCANGLPNMRKADPAVFKRFVQLEVTGKVVRGTANENTEFDQELIDAELPGILRVLVEAFERASHDRMMKTPSTSNGLPILAETQGANDDWKNKSDAVAVWLSEEFEFDAGMSARQSPTISALYSDFKLWCQDNGYTLMNRGSFKQQVSNSYTVAVSCNRDVVVGCARRRQGVPDVGSEDEVGEF